MNGPIIAAALRLVLFLYQPRRLKQEEHHFLQSHIRDALHEISRQLNDNTERPDIPLQSLQLHGEFACDLMDFVDPSMLLDDYIRRANGALIVWENELLELRPNRTVFATTILSALFMDNPDCWRAYRAHMRRKLRWFAHGL
jgi:hypothetical protein